MQHFSGEDEEHCLIFLHVKHTGKKEVWKKKISAKKEREEKNPHYLSIACNKKMKLSLL